MRSLNKRPTWRRVRQYLYLVARYVAVCAACLSAIWINSFMPPDPYWLMYGWLTPFTLWLIAECIRAYARPSYNEIAFHIGWGYGFIGAFVSVMWIGHGAVAFVGLCWASFQLGLRYWPHESFATLTAAPPSYRPAPPATTFGSAQWGTLEYMIEHGLVGDDGLMLGVIPGDADPHRLRYKGDRHLLTIAPTGSGKGVSAIIPNLLTHRASCLVVDPKGENALITAVAREMMGHSIHIVDPWHIAREAGPAARFNPLDWLTVGDMNIADNAMILADALVVPDEKGDSFWNQEAKALLQGLILYVATDELEAGQRHLGRVRDLLMLDGEDMNTLFAHMTQSVHHVVASTGARSLQKDEKLLSNVLASAQAQTSFLDSEHLRDSLSASDFRFEDLKANPATIYLVLPADRLSAFGRWLRLLIQQAITVTARDIQNKPRQPVLFLLDEMASLGRLTMVQEAYGLMRGFGMQLWGIVQDAGQLRHIYGESWEGFIANSGAVMYHGSLDNFSADYFSKLCGVATVLNFSSSRSVTSGTSYSTSHAGTSTTLGSGVSSSSSSTFNTALAQRKLAFPDELMRLRRDRQLVLIEHHHPILAGKLPWYEDDDLRRLGRNLHLERIKTLPRLLPYRPVEEWLSLFDKARA